jgi:hypothetical protein
MQETLRREEMSSDIALVEHLPLKQGRVSHAEQDHEDQIGPTSPDHRRRLIHHPRVIHENYLAPL